MALSERLLAIAALIDKGQTMADIGSDHGFLPKYLWDNGICPKIIVTDISPDSLQKAVSAFPDNPAGVFFRQGSGLAPLDFSEADVVVIAGMGGVLITQILGHDIKKTLSFKKYVLQPRNGAGKLRYWLKEAGFMINSEHLAREGKFICEIIAASPPADIETLPDLKDYPGDIRYEIPTALTDDNSGLLSLFIKRKIDIELKILKKMIKGGLTDGFL